MPSQTKALFDKHLVECREAIALYEHLEGMSIFKAEFSLRFVWIASVSAFDHYVSQIIIERSMSAYANNEALSPKVLSDSISFASAFQLKRANDIESLVVFREILNSCIKYKSFQSPDKVADGLSYIWSEKYKWDKIAKRMGLSPDVVRGTLENIVDRRNLIAHNADYDEARRGKLPIKSSDAGDVVVFYERLVSAIDGIIFDSALIAA